MMSDQDRTIFLATLRQFPWQTRVWTPNAIKAVVASVKAQSAKRTPANE